MSRPCIALQRFFRDYTPTHPLLLTCETHDIINAETTTVNRGRYESVAKEMIIEPQPCIPSDIIRNRAASIRGRGVDSWLVTRLESRLESHFCDSWLDSSHGPLRLATRLGLDPLTRTSHVESRSSHLATGRSWCVRRNGIGPIWKFLRQVSCSNLSL